jgi:hypothetical protein
VLVQHCERDAIVMKAAMLMLFPEVGKSVMHPPQIPLEREPESAVTRLAGHSRPCG